MIKPSTIVFEDPKLKESLNKLKDVDSDLFKQLNNALDEIEKNAFCSTQIPKRLFPKKWKHYSNLWKYDLPNAWRLIYTIAPPEDKNEIKVLSIILDWMPHKEYGRVFNYE